ncbi:MAG: glycosyltransferase [Myxococcota bacterium]|nr:glycosyltransferase [Myxococcota bacterium]
MEPPARETQAVALTLVIPVRDEPGTIEATLDELAAHAPRPYAVHVVYDDESDTTLPVLRRRSASGQETLVLVRNRYGPGAAAALRTGLESVESGYAVVVMADLCDGLEALPAMLELADAGCDVVCGSRYSRGGRMEGGPRLKGLLSRLAGLSLYHLAGVPTRDATNSFKLYRKSFLDTIEIESRGGFEIGMEITVKAFAAGRRIGEVPATWRDRSEGESKFRLLRWLPAYLRWYRLGLRTGLARRLGGSTRPEARSRRDRS